MPSPRDILKEHWGYENFRPLQEDIVQSVLDGNDTLALLPTGGGKSICFQVPAMARPGLTLVISPLIALMRDQVDQLNRRHIAATYINSSLSYPEIDRKLQKAMEGRYKFLYLAPERIETEMFQARLPQMNVTLIAVDEAHCISQWGYDFRPAYLRIGLLREMLPDVPVIALTATAPPVVRDDIVDKLDLKEPAVFTKSFRRENLGYHIESCERVPERILELAEQIGGTGIVYARTRKRVQALAKMLQKAGHKAEAYHGGMKSSERNRVQEAWIKDELRIITATNAFGMGIDKADVRFVIHYNLPADIESYYQEAGRGGRDGQPALAIAFHNVPDIEELQRWVRDQYPSWDMLTRHFEVLCEHFGIANTGNHFGLHSLDLPAIGKRWDLNPLKLYNSIKLLAQEGLIYLQERPDDYGYIRVKVPPKDILGYKKSYPLHSRLIDNILRWLGGAVYTDIQRFFPPVWARKLEIELEELLLLLDQLAARGIIQYRPPASTPMIMFRTARRRLLKEELSWERYDFLVERAQARLAAMEKYVETPAKGCRSRMMENYFGEKSTTDCGRCDFCLGKAAGRLNQAIDQQIREAIMARLSDGEVEARALLQSLKVGTSTQRREVLREMMDEGLIKRGRGLGLRLD